MFLLTEIGTSVLFASKAISALDLSWPLIAPCWPHTLTTLPLRVGCAEFTEESQETVPETGCLQGTSAPETWNTRLWYWQQGQTSPQESRFGSVMQLEGLMLGLPVLYMSCADVKTSAELCLSGDSHRFKEWILRTVGKVLRAPGRRGRSANQWKSSSLTENES